jgi:deazaflavin-dependent oxidoreductase (nitroreductase family)
VGVPAKYSVVLTHYGRRTGKAYKLKVWFVEIDHRVWVGTQDGERNWARNLCANGKVDLDFGGGPKAYLARQGTASELQRFRTAIRAKHPVLSRVIEALARGKTPSCFELTPAAP